MSDTHPPGGWPWGKGKQGSQNPGSDAAQGSQAQLQEKAPTEAGSQTPIRTKGESAPSQAAPSQKAPTGSAFRSPESVTNKSVKYEDEQPVSVEAPGSNRSFSRTGKEPSDANVGEEEEGVESEAPSRATETARSKKGDLPEDEGKDLTEPAEGNGDDQTTEKAQSEKAQSEKPQSQTGSGFTSIMSGAKHMFGGGSTNKGTSAAPEDSVSQLKELTQSNAGETLTMPGGGDGSGSGQEDTPAETDEDTTEGQTQTGAPTTTAQQTGDDDDEEGYTNISGEELRPEDSITHAADNSRLPTEGQTQTEGQTNAPTVTQGFTEGQTTPGFTEGQTTEGYTDVQPTEAQTQFTKGQTEAPTEGQTQYTEGQTEAPTEGQTQYTEGQTEGQTEFPEGQTELPEGQTEVPDSQIPEGEQLPEGVTAEGEQLPEGQLPEGQLPEDQQTETTGYETGTTETAVIDYSILKGCQVNKLGNVVNEKGQAIGRIVSGITSHLIGRKVDENGIIWNDSGKEIGRAEPIPDNELQELLDAKPFESFEGNVIDGKGWVKWQDQTVGKIVEGDLKVLQGKSVDAEGDVLDKSGNVIGKAERYEEEEPEEEVAEEIDYSILAGKRVNKAGNVVDSSGVIYGRVIDGDLKNMIGRMCNKNGEIVSESGDVLGHAELVSEGEREGSKEGPFAELSGLTVAKDGTVVTPSGDIVGRLVSGDPKVLAGRSVDEDGDVLDGNGNVLGHAERWEPEEEEAKEPGILAGLHVNKEGNVVDSEGNIIAKLTSGDPYICAGKEIDDDGDVLNAKGMTIGHVTLLSDLKEEEEPGLLEGLTVNSEGNVIDKNGSVIAKLTSGDPYICAGKEIDRDGDVVNSKGMTVGHVTLLSEIKEEGETEEEKEARLQLATDKKLATQMAMCLEQCLDKIRPICKMITSKIEAAEKKPEDERDEEALVREVRPLIEEGGNILREAHGIIRGLDPDGHIQANAKHKTGTREATPEEFHLAEVIKEVRIFPISRSNRINPCQNNDANCLPYSSPVPSPRPSRAPSASSRTCRTPRRSSTPSGASWANPSSRSSPPSACCSRVCWALSAGCSRDLASAASSTACWARWVSPACSTGLVSAR